MDSTSGEEAPAQCPTCGVALAGEFCHACGERRFDPQRDSLVRYFGAFFAAVGSLEGKWIRAVASLFLRPGELAARWRVGRRIDAPRPWSLFFAANLVYYLAAERFGIGLLRSPLRMQAAGTPWKGAVREALASRGFEPDLVDRWADRGELAAESELASFVADYDAMGASVSKLAVVVLIPMFAALLIAVRRLPPRSGPPSPPVEALVHATHYVAWWLLGVVLLAWSAIAALAG